MGGAGITGVFHILRAIYKNIGMTIKCRYLISLLTALCMLPLINMQGQQKIRFKSLEDALRSRRSLGRQPGPIGLTWINGGDQYSYTSRNAQTGKAEIRSFDPATGADQLVISSENLHYPDSDSNFQYRSFQWSADSRNIVFETNYQRLYRRSGVSDYYVYSLQDKSMKLAARGARTAGLSPDGRKVGIERNGNLYLYDLASKQEQQLTEDTGENLFNGHYDWVYEEEFGKGQAWSWSPDSRYIAFWHFDESAVPIFQMTNYEGSHPEYVKIPIPQPGDPNPVVSIAVVDTRTGKTSWLNTGETGDFYTPRVYWTSEPGVVAVMTLNRAENDMKLFFFDLNKGTHRQVMEERNDTWVAIFNFYTGVDDMMFFPEKSHNFFWISDRSGFYQIYRYDYNGNLINRVNHGNWDVNLVTGIDPETQRLYYTSAEASPLEEQLYSIQFDGSGEKRLSPQPGYHRINMSPNDKYYLDYYSNTATPPHIELWGGTDHRLIKTLDDGKGISDFISTHAYSPLELFKFRATDGTMLDGSMVKPPDFDSTEKYPVIFAIYGGPESHGVYNSFEQSTLIEFLAQQGYFIINVNNRGIAGYGSAFMKIVYKQLGKYESGDVADAAKYLATLPYIDSAHMAIMGTSYGGYSTVYTMVTHPGVFCVGIANSAVTDWRLYDDIYTERYMAPLSDNLDGYKESSAITHASGLKGHLLLIHSTMDDNVHPRNTMQMLTALSDAGKDVDLRIYPPGGHGAAYNASSALLIQKVSFQYLERYLKGKFNQPNINQ
jgi:dipeptidyl-peptidase-4